MSRSTVIHRCRVKNVVIKRNDGTNEQFKDKFVVFGFMEDDRFTVSYFFNIFKNGEENSKHQKGCFSLQLRQLCGIETGRVQKKRMTFSNKRHLYMSVIKDDSVLLLSDPSETFVDFTREVKQRLNLVDQFQLRVPQNQPLPVNEVILHVTSENIGLSRICPSRCLLMWPIQNLSHIEVVTNHGKMCMLLQFDQEKILFETSRALAISRLIKSYIGTNSTRTTETQKTENRQVSMQQKSENWPWSSVSHAHKNRSLPRTPREGDENYGSSVMSDINGAASYITYDNHDVNIQFQTVFDSGDVLEGETDLENINSSNLFSHRKCSLPYASQESNVAENHSKRTESLPNLPMVEAFLGRSLVETQESVSSNCSIDTLSSDMFFPQYFQRNTHSQWVSVDDLDVCKDTALQGRSSESKASDLTKQPPVPPRTWRQQTSAKPVPSPLPRKPMSQYNARYNGSSDTNDASRSFMRRKQLSRSRSFDHIYVNVLLDQRRGNSAEDIRSECSIVHVSQSEKLFSRKRLSNALYLTVKQNHSAVRTDQQLHAYTRLLTISSPQKEKYARLSVTTTEYWNPDVAYTLKNLLQGVEAKPDTIGLPKRLRFKLCIHMFTSVQRTKDWRDLASHIGMTVEDVRVMSAFAQHQIINFTLPEIVLQHWQFAHNAKRSPEPCTLANLCSLLEKMERPDLLDMLQNEAEP